MMDMFDRLNPFGPELEFNDVDIAQAVDEHKDDELLQNAIWGREAEGFAHHRVWKWIQEQLQSEVDQYTNELIDCAPDDKSENIRLRMEIKMRALIPHLIAVKIRTGQLAAQQIEIEDAESEDTM